MTIEELLKKEEGQTFERKSIQIRPSDPSNTLCAFANADGGIVAIGISDKHRRIEGVDRYSEQLNEILRTAIDFCNPSVPLTSELVSCKNEEGKEHVSVAAILLFGRCPQQFFPRARIRFIRYDGTEAKVGKDMNVIKDVIFEGRILDQLCSAVDFIKIQMKEKTYLGKDSIFVTKEEYGKFVRTEIVVNAVAHRDYGISGTEIQIKMFDDRLEVESPGTFAGKVKKENIRYTHYSRNPKIASFLKDYGFVKEYGEGVDRMCKELEAIVK